MSDDEVQVEVDRIVRETDEAMLVEFDGEEVWLPLSQVSAIHRGKSPSVTIKRWLAEKRGLV